MSLNEWKEVRLGEVCDINKESYSAKEKWQYINYLDTGNITENKIESIQFLDTRTDKIPSRAKRKVYENDIIYSTVRPNQKHFGILKKPLDNMLVSTGFVVITGKQAEVDNSFLYYYLTQQYLVDMLHTIGEHSTSAYPSIKPSDIESLNALIPPINEQKSIADTLSCLDDKIELNNQINKTLEEMAQAIFKSWFVDFEPFQDGEFVDSQLGRIPKGWRVGCLGDIANITMGQSPKGSSYNEKNEGTVFYQGRTDFGWRYPKVRLYTTEPKRLANKGDVLLSVRAPVGDINVAMENCCIGRGLAALNSKNNWNSYLLYQLLYLKDSFNVYNGEGTVFGSINKSNLNNMQVLISPDDIIADYQSIVENLDNIIENNVIQVRTLTNIRDTLLPKLMFGEIRIPIEEVQ